MTDVPDPTTAAATSGPSPPLVPTRALRGFLPHIGTALGVLGPASYLIAYVNQVGKALVLGIPLDVVSVSIGSIVGVFVALLFVFYMTATWVGLFYRWVSRKAKGKGGALVKWCAAVFLFFFPLFIIYGADWDEWVPLLAVIAGLWVVIFILAVMAAAAQHVLPGPTGAAGRGIMRSAPLTVWDLIERVVGKWAMFAILLATVIAGYSYSLGRASVLNTQTYFVLDGTPQRALLAIYGDTVVLGYVPPKGGSLTRLVITQLEAGSLVGSNQQVGPLVRNCEPIVGCH